MAWLHTWSGLLVGWILFAVFLTGTAAYLRPEITRWMEPEMRSLPAASTMNQGTVAQALVDHLQNSVPQSPYWIINMPDARQRASLAYWLDRKPGGRGFGYALLDPRDGAPLAVRGTLGGEFFYRFHFQLHYLNVPLARWIVSFCAMSMLVAIISGIITHKRIFADFFTFRPGKGRRSWLDGHALAAVMALPYHLVITYSGLVTLMVMTMPWGTMAAYKGDRAAGLAEIVGSLPPVKPSGTAAPLAPMAPMIAAARQHWGGDAVGMIVVQAAGDRAARVRLSREDDSHISFRPQTVVFDGATGQLLEASGDGPAPAAETRGVLYGLHIARFAGPWLRALFICAGLAGTVMVATGCVLWAQKTRTAQLRAFMQAGGDLAGFRPGFGLRLAEQLNLAAIAGLPLAMAVYFGANRLLPLDLANRANWEMNSFFIAWGLCLLHAVARPMRAFPRRGWVQQFGLGAVLFALLPVLDLATTGHIGAPGWWGLGALDWDFAVGFWGIAAVLAAIAWAVGRVPARQKALGKTPAGAAAEAAMAAEEESLAVAGE